MIVQELSSMLPALQLFNLFIEKEKFGQPDDGLVHVTRTVVKTAKSLQNLPEWAYIGNIEILFAIQTNYLAATRYKFQTISLIYSKLRWWQDMEPTNKIFQKMK